MLFVLSTRQTVGDGLANYMGAQYTTIFEVSYFGPGGLGMPLLFLSTGIVALLVMTTHKTSTRREGAFKGVFLFVWGRFG